MKVIIRTDASEQIGSGHVMRCLALADVLKDNGFNVKFWMLPLAGNLISFVTKKGYENITEAEKADLYIVDHYAIDYIWESHIKSFASKIMVIDDLANRKHQCDLILDQNFVPHFLERYDNLVPSECIKLLGPEYLILRDEFFLVKDEIKQPKQPVQNLLVFMGGTDPTGETMKVLEAMQQSTFSKVHIVVGLGNPLKETIQMICERNNYYFHCQIDYLAKLMSEVDFCLGAGGMTMWERNFLQLPSTATIVADNQTLTTNYAGQCNYVFNMGWHEQVTVEKYKTILTQLENGEEIYPHENFLTNVRKHKWLDIVKTILT